MPGQPGLRHRVGGLEKADVTGEVSHDPFNHEIMVLTREEKVKRVANYIPKQKVIGDEKGDLLVVGWGGTFGALFTAVNELREEGKNISLAQFNFINPLPKNTAEVFSNFKTIVVCELNLGQFARYLRSEYPQFHYIQYNKIQGLPFMIYELKQKFTEILEEI
jgi:2-oxoglutarate/2-oxoacid ferredoxin oxidoreductase subunit alpha